MPLTESDRESTSWRQLAPLVVTLCMVSAVGLAVAHPAPGMVSTNQGIALVTCLVLFVAAEYAKVHIEVRRNALSVSLSDLPLLFGLFTMPLPWLFGTRMVAAVIGMALRPRQPAKGLFNLSLFAAEVAVAGVVVGLIPAQLIHGDVGTSHWVSSLLVVLAIDALGVASVVVAMRRLAQWPDWHDIAVMVTSLLVSGALCASLAALSLIAVAVGAAGYLLLIGLAGIGLLAYRSYSRLSLHHADLNRVIDASHRVVSAATRAELLAALRQEAATLVQAEDAELWSADQCASGQLPPSGLAPAVYRADTGGHAQRMWLRDRGFREALVVPMDSVRRADSLLVVNNRMCTTESFSVEDLRLVQTLVSHAAAAMNTLNLSERLEFDMRHDRLTGLPNRDALLARLAAVPAGRSAHTAVIVVDIDRFQQINDALGHPAGDEVLTQAAKRLQKLAPPGSWLARVDADEFALMLVSVTSAAEVEACVEELRRCFAQPFSVSGTVIGASATFGLARTGTADAQPKDLLRLAQIGLVRAKDRATPWAWYSGDLLAHVPGRLNLAADLRQVVAQDRLDVQFAPVVPLRAGVEDFQFQAVPIWRHPARGVLRGDDFWSAAADADQVAPLALHVLRKALQACATWHSGAVLRVALPGRVLNDPQVVNQLSVWTAQYGVLPNRVNLGVDEGALLDADLPDAALNQLRALGFRLYVLDFGTGQSSLARLGSLPIQGLRVGRGFIAELDRSQTAAAVVRSIVQVAHTFGLTVSASGVDTPQLLQAVTDLGCDTAEGLAIGATVRGERVDSIQLGGVQVGLGD